MMSPIYLEPTKVTPKIILDPIKKIIGISGRSSPASSIDFYEPIITHIKQSFKDLDGEIIADFNLEYFNTSSSKSIYNIFKALQSIQTSGNLTINWHYFQDDEDMMENGEDYQSLLDNLKFNFIPH